MLCGAHSFVERAIALLKQQNEVVATHPNSHVYSQLQSLVDFDGFYLESEPCLVCNDPEVPYSVREDHVCVWMCGWVCGWMGGWMCEWMCGCVGG